MTRLVCTEDRVDWLDTGGEETVTLLRALRKFSAEADEQVRAQVRAVIEESIVELTDLHSTNQRGNAS